MRSAFEAFNRRDLDALVGFCHPDVEWTPPLDLPGSKTYHGHAGVRESVADMLGVFPDLQAEPARIEHVDDAVVGLYVWRGSADASGASIDPFEIKVSAFAEFDGDLVRRVRFWRGWDGALEAAGLQS